MKINTNTLFILFLSLILSSVSMSQFNRYGGKKRTQGLGDFVRPFNVKGWYFAPGVTLTPKMNFIKYDPLLSAEGFFASNLKQQSKVGAYFEVGRYKLLSTKGILSYIDYGLSYKFFRAGQTYDLFPGNNSYSQDFKSHSAGLHFNANNVMAINKNFFFQNTLGVNADYQFIQKLETNDNTGFTNSYQEDPSKIWAQLHYKFGVGIRIGEVLYAIPSVEIPILNGWQWEGGRSTFGAFNSRYRPVIISVRFAWLNRPDCPKVWDNDSNTTNGGGL